MTIYQQEHSEQQTFKGMMAAGGCGALILALLGVMMVVVIDSIEPPFRNQLWWQLWPVYLLVLIGLFLLLQLLQFVFHSKPTPQQPEEDSSDTKLAK